LLLIVWVSYVCDRDSQWAQVVSLADGFPDSSSVVVSALLREHVQRSLHSNGCLESAAHVGGPHNRYHDAVG
jgi:hypothetical protein